MTSHKVAKKLIPTTPDLRAKDLNVLRAEIDHFRQKITEKASAAPYKAAIILNEWLNRPTALKNPAVLKKKTAA